MLYAGCTINALTHELKLQKYLLHYSVLVFLGTILYHSALFLIAKYPSS